MIKKSLDKTSRPRRAKDSATVTNPELVFGIVGPIGVDIEAVMDALSEALKDVGYTPIPIHLTQLIHDKRIKLKPDFNTYYSRFHSLIDYANAYRKLAKSASALAGIAILTVRRLRAKITEDEGTPALSAWFQSQMPHGPCSSRLLYVGNPGNLGPSPIGSRPEVHRPANRSALPHDNSILGLRGRSL